MQHFNYIENEPTTSEVARMLAIDAAEGDYTTLKNVVDYLVYERGYSTERLVKFATRTLRIPYDVAIATLVDLCSYTEQVH